MIASPPLHLIYFAYLEKGKRAPRYRLGLGCEGRASGAYPWGWDGVWVVRLVILAQLNGTGFLPQACERDGGRVGCLDGMVLLMMIAASAEVGRG